QRGGGDSMFHCAGFPARGSALECAHLMRTLRRPPPWQAAAITRVPQERVVEKELHILLAHLGRSVLLALIMATPRGAAVRRHPLAGGWRGRAVAGGADPDRPADDHRAGLRARGPRTPG